VEGGTERKEELQGRRKTGRSKGRANKWKGVTYRKADGKNEKGGGDTIDGKSCDMHQSSHLGTISVRNIRTVGTSSVRNVRTV
jgi:hypothetical protein